MRAILVDWLVQVHSKFRLLQETLYMCIAIMDRFLQVSAAAGTLYQRLTEHRVYAVPSRGPSEEKTKRQFLRSQRASGARNGRSPSVESLMMLTVAGHFC